MAKPLRGRNDQNPEVSEETEVAPQDEVTDQNPELSGEMEIKDE